MGPHKCEHMLKMMKLLQREYSILREEFLTGNILAQM